MEEFNFSWGWSIPPPSPTDMPETMWLRELPDTPTICWLYIRVGKNVECLGKFLNPDHFA